MNGTVTVTRVGGKGSSRVKTAFCCLPEQEFGPYEWSEAVRDLRVSALLSAVIARNLVLDALADGSATHETG